jgi:hypothetical protein
MRVVKTIAVMLLAPIVASVIGVFAQQATTASTEDGRKILLYPDGTWRLLKTPVSEPRTARSYRRPTEAKLFVKVPIGPFGVWINQQKWKQDAPVEEDATKITFHHKKGGAYAMLIAERASIPIEKLKKIVLANTKEGAPDARVLSEERRTLNDKQVLCLKIGGTVQNIPFVYYGYYYGGSEGTLQVVTYTATNLFDEFKSDCEEFLNGTQIGQASAVTKSEAAVKPTPETTEDTEAMNEWFEFSPDHDLFAATRLIPDQVYIQRHDLDGVAVAVFRGGFQSGTVVARHDFRGRVFSHIEWSPDSKFLLFTTASSGGHSPSHASAFLFCASDNSFRDVEPAIGSLVSPNFRFEPPDIANMEVQKGDRPEEEVKVSLAKIMQQMPRLK